MLPILNSVCYYWYVTGTDYDSGPYTAMFPADTTTASLSISITNDNIVEMNETFSLTINPSSDVTVVDPDDAVVTIVDDDSEWIY